MKTVRNRTTIDLRNWQVIQRPLLPDTPHVIDGVQIVVHGYRGIGELLQEVRRDTIQRPTEYDAIISMIRGYTSTPFSNAGHDYGGGDRKAYTRPAKNERERRLDEQHEKHCAGHIHEPRWLPVYMFNKNSARKDGYDNYCQECRRAISAESYQRRKAA